MHACLFPRVRRSSFFVESDAVVLARISCHVGYTWKRRQLRLSSGYLGGENVADTDMEIEGLVAFRLGIHGEVKEAWYSMLSLSLPFTSSQKTREGRKACWSFQQMKLKRADAEQVRLASESASDAIEVRT
jgi:hypothetical protein